MGSPIARRPAGLLDLLLTQQQGKNPTQLLDTVQSVLDLSAFYEAERLQVSSQGVAVSAVGNSSALAVPASEAWKINFISVDWTFATVNQELDLRLQLFHSGSEIGIHAPGMVSATRATDRGSVCFQSNQPLIVPAGTILRSTVQSINLDGQPNIAITLRCGYVRMDI